MERFEGPHNSLIQGVVKPGLRVDWDRPRAWHGDQVAILVTTEGIPDGASVDLTVQVKGGSTIDSIKGVAVASSNAIQSYKIDWKDKGIAPGSYQFAVLANLAEHGLQAESGILLVDLVPPLFSV